MVSFADVKSAYPQHNGQATSNPCDVKWYLNQCAIRVSRALVGADPKFLKGFDGRVCPRHGEARGAKSLAKYLKKKLGAPTVFRRTRGKKATAHAHETIASHGIIFYKRPSINHIDIWDAAGGLLNPDEPRTMTFSDPDHDATYVWFWRLG